MTLKASLYFAKSLIFPRTQKSTVARKSLYGSIICIALSVVPLVSVLSVTTGMINGMTERLIGLSSGHLEVRVANGIEETKNEEKFSAYAKGFENVKGVTKAYPEVTLFALGVGKNIRTGAFLRGVPDNIFEENQSFKTLFEVHEGDTSCLKEASGTPNVIIGDKMAETLSLKAGDVFRIITTRKAGDAVVPKVTSFKVGAIVSSGYQELDELWIFVPLKVFFRSFTMANANFNILLETEDAFSPSLVAVQHNVKKHCGRFANVYRWDQVNAARFENFSSTKVMLVFIMMMIIFVASINISSAIVMLVMERRKEIAILKSTGASPFGITLAFILTGLYCAATGLLIGVPAGILVSVKANELIHFLEWFVNLFKEVRLMDPAYYLQTIPVAIPVNQIIMVIAGTLVLSVLVSVIPSVKAGKEKPSEGLKL